MAAVSMTLKINTAKMLLRYFGLTHEDILARDQMARYEFAYANFFDVKLSYDGYSKSYYIKSYPAEPERNMKEFLRHVRLFLKRRKSLDPIGWREREEAERAYYKLRTNSIGRWIAE